MPFTSTTAKFSDLVDQLIKLMNSFIPLLIGVAIIFFFIGLIRYIYKSGDAKGRAAGRDNIIWGLIGLFIIFTLWGILRFLQIAFFPNTVGQINDLGNPRFPTTQNPTA
ncbi:MAG: pilin [Candidatus Adlerbacteria bacterium]